MALPPAGGCHWPAAACGCPHSAPWSAAYGCWAAWGGVGQAVPERAGWRVGGSTGGRRRAPPSLVCHWASTVERYAPPPVPERHSVVARHWAASVVERHSEVVDRQPMPSGGKAG